MKNVGIRCTKIEAVSMLLQAQIIHIVSHLNEKLKTKKQFYPGFYLCAFTVYFACGCRKG